MHIRLSTYRTLRRSAGCRGSQIVRAGSIWQTALLPQRTVLIKGAQPLTLGCNLTRRACSPWG